MARSIKRAFKLKNHQCISVSEFKIENEYETILIDEFFHQVVISFEDVIKLDKRGINVIIRGSIEFVQTSKPIPDFFVSYLKNNYPETLI